MSSKSKQKGSRFEREVADYLAAVFPGVDRGVLRGTRDRGDIANLPGWTIECKNERILNLAGAVDEALREAINADTHYWAAVVKRRGKGVPEAYAVMPLRKLRGLIKDLRRAESQNPASPSPNPQNRL